MPAEKEDGRRTTKKASSNCNRTLNVGYAILYCMPSVPIQRPVVAIVGGRTGRMEMEQIPG